MTHRAEAEAAGGGVVHHRHVEAAAVVDDIEVHMPGVIGERDHGRPGVGVAGHVGERPLGDAHERGLDRHGERVGIAADDQPDGHLRALAHPGEGFGQGARIEVGG